jgi:membrane protease YdiL (CAAX protease family)
MAHRITTIPPRMACWRASLERRRYRSALALGTCLGVAGTLCALCVSALVLQFFPPELWGHSAAAGLARLTPVGIFLAAVVYAPIIETLLGQVLPIEAAHRLGAPPVACVLLSALVFAYGHYLNGGLAHGTTTFFGGMIFACAYVNMRWAGIAPAALAAATAHAVQNGTVLFVIGPLFPEWA